MPKFNNIPDFKGMAERVKKDALIMAKKEGIDFFVESFDNEGFTNASFEKWQERATPVDYKLLQLTSALKNSIQVLSNTNKSVVFGSDEAYAEIHNEGGVINVPITEKTRKFFWFMYKSTGLEQYKFMAISKKDTMNITIPKRQFMGESKTLMNHLNNKVANRIEFLFKQL